jgi:hypothetical protein
MIRELEMRRLYINLWHVTRRAVFIGYRTTLTIAGFRSLTSECVTLQTSLVVISRVFSEWLMRVVTRNAAYFSIVRITLAVENTIRLKTNIVDLHTLQQREFLSATVACSAKVLRQFIAPEQSGIVDGLCRCIARFDRCDVRSTWSMTSFAAYTVRKFIEPELRAGDHRARRVATKAI